MKSDPDQERWHGTPGGYTNHACRCPRCTEAWRLYARDLINRWRATNLSLGLTSNGDERTSPYNAAALRRMKQFGLTPDPRFER